MYVEQGFLSRGSKVCCRCDKFIANSADKESCPDEIWFGRKPNIIKFKVFGCKAYAHIPNQKRTKLEMKSTKCIFVGFPENTKAYKLYNTSTKKVIISRDVVFFEGNESIVQEQQDVQTNEHFGMFESFPTDDDIMETTEPG